jgi:hypothetical protein
VTVCRRNQDNTFSTTISILDFVTICLGATLLLVVMVPNQTSSKSTIASHQEALELARQFFALNTLQHNVHLGDDLVANHPSLPSPKSRAPFEYNGKRLSVLDESQRVRRAEVLVEMPLSQPERLERTLKTLRDRGVGYVNFRTFSTTGSASAAESQFSSVLSASDTASSVLSALDPVPTSEAALGLAAAEVFRHQSPTPSEPVVVIVNGTDGLESVSSELKNSICKTSATTDPATLLLVGPAVDNANAGALETALGACPRSDYMAVP